MFFRTLALKAAQATGSSGAFLLAIFVIVAWLASGPYCHFSDTWQLVINSVTSVATFLMVFLIQNTQNRDAQAINLKLDELIHSIGAASNQMMDIESLSDDELNVLHKRYEKIREECVKRKKPGKK